MAVFSRLAVFAAPMLVAAEMPMDYDDFRMAGMKVDGANTLEARVDYLKTQELGEPIDNQEFVKAFMAAWKQTHPEGKMVATAGAEVANMDRDATNKKLENADAAIAGSSALGFSRNLGAPQKAAASESLLFAEMVAKKTGHEPGSIPYFNKYADVMRNLGWTTGTYDWQKYHSSSGSLQMDKAVLQIIQAALAGNPDMKSVITKMLTAMTAEENQDSKWITLFENKSKSASKRYFQVGGVWQDYHGMANMNLFTFQYDMHGKSTQVLWFKWSTSNTHLEYINQAIGLSLHLYDPVKDVVMRKMGRAREDNIMAFEI